MFEKVLYATDFSEPACKTLDWVSGIADVREIVILHVIDATRTTKKGWVHDLVTKKAEFELEDQMKHLQKAGLRGEVRLEVITGGDVAETILSVAKDEEVSLIVIGTRGMGMIKSVLLGSVSRTVLHKAMTHILIMRQSFTGSFNGKKYEKFPKNVFSKILYPTDFSKPAYEVVPLLENLKGFEKILLLHVITRGKTKQEIEGCVENARGRLEAIRKELQNAGKEAAVSVRLGSPPAEINRFAEEAEVSLVVMGRHGYGWMRELMVGSTTYAVAKKTRRPLLIVQPGLVSR